MKTISQKTAIALLIFAAVSVWGYAAERFSVHPQAMTLKHLGRAHSLIAGVEGEDGYDTDVTDESVFASANPAVATVDSQGWVKPVSNGKTEVTVRHGKHVFQVSVEVALPQSAQKVSFREDVMPVLSKGTCNMGACHGYSLGKNGFKLSLRGADPEKDYPALTDEFGERRLNRHHPEASLLLLKGTGEVPHEGGVKLDKGSPMYDLVLRWIGEGARDDDPKMPKLESIKMVPEKVTARSGSRHHFQVVARYSDGTLRDVSKDSIYTVNTERIARSDDDGLVTVTELGESAIIARYENLFAVSNLIVLPQDKGFRPTPVPAEGVVDRHVIAKLNDLRITPSAVVDDETFLRRVSIDLIGLQPTPSERAAFVADPAVDKRAKQVEALMGRPEFIDWWTLKWGDLLQNSRNTASDPAVYAFREWIRSAVAMNMPLDRFARELLTARGGYSDHAASAYFTVSKDTDDTIQRATQVFCGVRMLCARCHPHPFENWTQTDYYGLHSFFNQVATKVDTRQAGATNAKTVVVNLKTGPSTNPRTRKPEPPRYLGGGVAALAETGDRREDYVRWLTAGENPHFARSLVNRFWSYFFHRGIIDPVDDLRSTSPPINPALLDALTADFVKSGFDMRHLVRVIVNSQTYQRSSVPNDSNAHDDANFSKAIPRRIPAEALLDSLVQATGVKENFGGVPAGFTAAQLPDGNVQSSFLSLFGKPQRMEACECERDTGTNMLQALHFINGQSILNRVSNASGRPALLLKEKVSDEQAVEQLYLWSLSRLPSVGEREAGLRFFGEYGEKRAEAMQDLMWALLNSRDFMMLR